MIAAIYARKSNADERSGKDGKSIVRQEELAREFIARIHRHPALECG